MNNKWELIYNKFFYLVFTCLCSFNAFASVTDTVVTHSSVMNKNIKAVIIIPKSYDSKKEFPTLYLLNGFAGNYSDFVKLAPEVKQMADKYNMVIVCPDGNYDSWYIDSPINSRFRYETYIVNELVKWIDLKYKTIKSPLGRAITGLSMGGYGALRLAIRHQDIFGAVGGMSSAVDFRAFPDNWNLKHRLGSYNKHVARWNHYIISSILNNIIKGKLKIFLDCGVSDPYFYKANLELHNKMLKKHIPHDFTVRPGGHDWKYWNTALKYQALFMSDFFTSN